MKVAVFGATGVLGRHVVPRLIERGDEVIAVRHRRSAGWLDALNCASHTADILDAPSILPVVDGCEAVMHLATAIPEAGASADWTGNDRVRQEGTANLIAACRTLGVSRYVQQSIAMLCQGQGEKWLDERAPITTTPVTRSAAEMERLVMASALDYRIVRGGLFYGTDTGTVERWRRAARCGELVVPGDGSAYLSLVHVSDMAQALLLALHADTDGMLVNVVDDSPVTWRELFDYIALAEGAAPPGEGGPQWFGSFRLNNTLAKRVLGWCPHFASWRSGLA